MKKYILLFLLLPLLIFSQGNGNKINYLVEYRLSYLTDSTDVKSQQQEDFKLYITDSKTYFASSNYILQDSILKSMKETKVLNLSAIPHTKFKYSLVKENSTVNYYESIVNYKLSYNEPLNLMWKLLEEKKIIDNKVCHKAEVEYGNRKWIAWFTEEIPIHQGPYKFQGLPGLIIEIYDTQNNHNFKLIGLKKTEMPDYLVFSSKFLDSHKKISKSDFLKTEKQIKNNLVKELSLSGFTVSSESLPSVKSNLKKNNNTIEK